MFIRNHLVRIRREQLAGCGERDAERGFLSGPIGPDRRIHPDVPSFETRCPLKSIDTRRGNHLEPDGLPNSRGAWIPDGVRLQLPILLAPRLRKIGGVIFSAYYYLLFSARHQD